MKKDSQASITVEAALVIPVIIYTIFILMYFSFYLHDICTLESRINGWVHKVAMNLKHPVDLDNNEIIYEDINNRGVFYYIRDTPNEASNDFTNLLQRELRRGLFIVNISNIETKINQYIINVNVKIELKISLNPIKNILGQYSFREIEITENIHNPSEFIRMANVIMETMELNNGIDQWKNKLSKLFHRFAY